jgi:hypothetical protein
MHDLANDPFNVALREYRARCKQYAGEHGVRSFQTIDADVIRARLGLLLIVWNPKWHEMDTVFDGREAHRERHGDYIDYASEPMVWEGLRLLRQHYILDEVANA